MSGDDETLAFYDGQAATYADYAAREGERAPIAAFEARLAPGAAVLDLGCGSGWAAARLRDAGFAVTAMDGSAGLAAEAEARYGLAVRVARFEALADVAAFDGVWASFSLLHDTRAAMPGHLARIARALRPGGVLYLGLKEGAGEARDDYGRRYTYFAEDELRPWLAAAGFAEIAAERETGHDYAGAETRYLHLWARRP